MSDDVSERTVRDVTHLHESHRLSQPHRHHVFTHRVRPASQHAKPVTMATAVARRRQAHVRRPRASGHLVRAAPTGGAQVGHVTLLDEAQRHDDGVAREHEAERAQRLFRQRLGLGVHARHLAEELGVDRVHLR